MEFFYLINQQYNRTALQLNEDGTVVGFEHNNSTAQQVPRLTPVSLTSLTMVYLT